MSTSSVYQLYVDVKGCVTYRFEIDDLDYWDEFRRSYFRGQPLPAGWCMPPVEFGATDKPLHDFVWGSEVPFVSKRAKQALETITGNDVQFWPIGKVKGRDYFIFNVINLIDCLDLDRSEILYASDEPEKVLGVRKAVFVRRRLPEDVVVFKVPQDTGIIYSTGALVDCIREHELTGVGFEHPDDVGVSGPRNAFPDLPMRRETLD